MFKKRSRPASVRDKKANPVAEETKDEKSSGDGEAEVDEELGQNIEELILLRKLRKSKPGIDLEKLNRGEEKRKKKSNEPEIDLSQYGLHSTRRHGEARDSYTDEKERLAHLVRNHNFTQQTNALDVDKHMMAYIESEMEKRRGQAAKAAEEGKNEAFDPQAELYKIAERYKIEAAAKKDEEGNVTNSMGMLTSIPEVDLGMENRLKNIEETEKAKRELMEQRKTGSSDARRGPREEDYSTARFFKGKQNAQSDVHATEDAKRQAAGLPSISRPPRRNGQQEMATDEQVYERFKKRMKR